MILLKELRCALGSIAFLSCLSPRELINPSC